MALLGSVLGPRRRVPDRKRRRKDLEIVAALGRLVAEKVNLLKAVRLEEGEAEGLVPALQRRGARKREKGAWQRGRPPSAAARAAAPHADEGEARTMGKTSKEIWPPMLYLRPKWPNLAVSAAIIVCVREGEETKRSSCAREGSAGAQERRLRRTNARQSPIHAPCGRRARDRRPRSRCAPRGCSCGRSARC